MSVEAQVAQDLTDLLKLAVVAGGGLLVKYVRQHVKSQAVNNAVQGLNDIAFSVVASFNQKVVNDAKKYGTWTPELKQSVKQDAIDAVKEQGASFVKLLRNMGHDVEGLIADKVEQAVVGSKSAVQVDSQPSA